MLTGRVKLHGSGQVGSGRVGSRRVTRPDPQECENLLTRPDPTREISFFSGPTRGPSYDPLKSSEYIIPVGYIASAWQLLSCVVVTKQKQQQGTVRRCYCRATAKLKKYDSLLVKIPVYLVRF